MSLFISYCKKDGIFASQLNQAIQKRNITTWFDEKRLQPGDPILSTIAEEISNSDYFLIILSPASLQSQWVQQEREIAANLFFNRGKPTIIPALWKECDIPPDLIHIKYADFRVPSTFEKSINELCTGLINVGEPTVVHKTIETENSTQQPVDPQKEILKIQNLRVAAYNRELVSNVSLSLNSGEAVGIIGGSGSGKTTLIATVAGFIAQDLHYSGSIKLKYLNRDIELVGNRRDRSQYRRLVQPIGLYSLRESPYIKNAKVKRYLRGPWFLPNKVGDNKLHTILSDLDLDPHSVLTRQIRHLTLHETARVQLAKALLYDPFILVLDSSFHPFSSEIREELITILKSNLFRHLAVLVTSHNYSALKVLCDRIIFLDSGRIVEENTPEVFLSPPF